MADPTVFVVDDDPAVRHSLSRLIRQAGLNVETFASADEFLGMYRSDGPACLVLDVRMPGMDGFDLRSKLLESPSPSRWLQSPTTRIRISCFR